MARTYQTLATGDPATDRQNVLDLHFRNRELEQQNAELVAQNEHLALTIERLMRQAADHRSTGT